MRKHERLAQSAAASLPRRTYTSDLSANANLGCWKPPGRCQEVTPDLVVFRQEVFDDFLSHEPVILRRSGRMDLDNRPIGPPNTSVGRSDGSWNSSDGGVQELWALNGHQKSAEEHNIKAGLGTA